MSRKAEIFENVLTNPYDNGVFANFVQEFLNNVELVAPSSYKKVYNNFSYYVDGYYHIGNYTGNDGNKIAIFSVALRRGDSVERARTMQRNFVKPLCQTAHCGRCKLHFDFGVIASPMVPYRNLPQASVGMTANCRSLV